MRRRAPTILALTFAACTGTTSTPDAGIVPLAIDAGLEGAVMAADPFSPSCAPVATTGHLVKTLTSNNAAELSGGVLGNPDLIHGDLRHPVMVTVTGAMDPLVLGASFVARYSDEEEESVLGFVTVTTTGNETRCFVRAHDIRWLDAAGAEVARESQSYLLGSVGQLDYGYIDSCVGPGDTAYFVIVYPTGTPGAKLFSSTQRFELAIDLGEINPPAPGKVVPVAYRGCGKSPLFEVAIENRGNVPVAFWRDLVGEFILADDDGPLDWGFFSPRSGLGVEPPGAMMLVGGATFLKGKATRMSAYLAFGDPAQYARRPMASDVASLVDDVRADRAARRARWLSRRGSAANVDPNAR